MAGVESVEPVRTTYDEWRISRGELRVLSPDVERVSVVEFASSIGNGGSGDHVERALVESLRTSATAVLLVVAIVSLLYACLVVRRRYVRDAGAARVPAVSIVRSSLKKRR